MYKHSLVVVMLCGLVSSFPNPNQDSLNDKVSNEKQESRSLFSYFVSLMDTDDEPPRKKRIQYMSNPYLNWLYTDTSSAGPLYKTTQPTHFFGLIRRNWLRWPTRSPTSRDSQGMQEIRQSARTKTSKKPKMRSEIRTNPSTTTSSTIVTKKKELILDQHPVDRNLTLVTTKIPLRVLGQSTIKAIKNKQEVSQGKNSFRSPSTISSGDQNRSDSSSGELAGRKLVLQFSTPTKHQPLPVSMKSLSAKPVDTRPYSSTVRSSSTSHWNSSTITRHPLANISNQSTNESVASATKSLSLSGMKFQSATTVSRESTLSRVPIITSHPTTARTRPLTSSRQATNSLSSIARSHLMNTSSHPTTKDLMPTTDNRLENSTPTLMQMSTKEVSREEVTVGLHLHKSFTDNTRLADPESRVVKYNNSFGDEVETRSTTPINRLVEIQGRSGKDIPFREEQEGGTFLSSSQSRVWTRNTLSTTSNVRSSAIRGFKSSSSRITTRKPNSPSIQNIGQKEMPLLASNTPIGYIPNVMNNPESNSGHAERQVVSASVGSTKPRVWIPVIRAMDHSLTTLKPGPETVLTKKAVINTDNTKTPWWYSKIRY